MGKVRGCCMICLQRLACHRRKQDEVQGKGALRSPCDAKMTEVRRIKTATEEGHTLAGRGNVRRFGVLRRHDFMVVEACG